jgi:hypothetical protein
MTTPWLRSVLTAGTTLFFVLAFATGSEAAWVNRHLLREFLARPTVVPGGQPTLDAARVEACLRSARDLDGLAGSLDQLMIVIQDTTSRIEYAQHVEGRPQLPLPDRTEKQMRAKHEGGVAERAQLEALLDRDTKDYRARLASFRDGIKAYERDCTGSFRRDHLDAAKARLKMND